MKFRSIINADQFMDAQKIFYRNSKIFSSVCLAVSVLLTVLTAVYTFGRRMDIEFLALMLIFVAITLAGFLNVVTIAAPQKKAFETGLPRHDTECLTEEYALTPTGFTLTSEEGVRDIPWFTIRKIWSKKDLVFFRMKGIVLICRPADATAAQIHGYLAAVNPALAQRFKLGK